MRCFKHFVAFSRSNLRQQLALQLLIQTGPIFRFWVKKCLVTYPVFMSSKVGFDPKFFHSAGIFSYTSTWVLSIKSPSPPIYVGCPGNFLVHNNWSISVCSRILPGFIELLMLLVTSLLPLFPNSKLRNLLLFLDKIISIK